eukprot:TRINITY_DN71057_c0_g1_i1.p2 TRINITY_DN71057_c0_g1~~TRINITY_DN71057_c0_g1_i1.p2  ORF type:complete len:186 (+),score=4.10 TRINITY_DN71057_c0_g1_i1:102-659(+)
MRSTVCCIHRFVLSWASGPQRMASSTAYRGADPHLDHRAHPTQYQVARGEQGVLTVQPYKSELLPLWRFATPAVAEASSSAILAKFHAYREAGDFVGADMARKYLQMGYTRSRRYANHKGGKKYAGPVPADKKGQSGSHGRGELPRSEEDPVKAKSARIFKTAWEEAEADEEYVAQRKEHKKKYG